MADKLNNKSKSESKIIDEDYSDFNDSKQKIEEQQVIEKEKAPDSD